MTRGEIIRIVKRYIGVSPDGYLADFTYGSHCDFYPEYCDLDLNPFDYLREGTTRERFMKVLEGTPPDVQAKIVRGVLAKYPAGSTPPSDSRAVRSDEAAAELVTIAQRLERRGMVASSVPVFTSVVVQRALDDAETLMANTGPTSAIDRVHTALHGHLGYLCEQAGIDYERDATMVSLLKRPLADHPQLQDLGPRAGEMKIVLKGSGSILDALNPVRNKASLAHPNEMLLGEVEARLVINVARSLLLYIDGKVAAWSPAGNPTTYPDS